MQQLSSEEVRDYFHFTDEEPRSYSIHLNPHGKKGTETLLSLVVVPSYVSC